MSQNKYKLGTKGRQMHVPRFSYHTLSKITSNKSFAYGFSIFAIAFLVSVLSFSILAPIDSSNAAPATVTANIEAAGYYIGMTFHDVEMNMTATVTGAYAIAYDTITTKTNAPAGYKLYVSGTNAADYSATRPGNALYKDGDSTISPFIAPTSGTFSSPSTLAMNTWGASNSALTTGQEATYFAMPLLGSPQLIQTTNTANETGVDKRLDFGFRADYTMPVGSYSNTIIYTAAANANSGGTNELAISPSDTESLAGGESVVITTSLYTNYDLGTGDVTVTIGGQTCTVTAVTTNTTLGTKQITCTTPAQTLTGAKDVYVNIPIFGWSATLTGGYTVNPTFWNISYMQEMTPAACNTVYTPSNATGASASIITSQANYTATANGTNQVPSRTLQDYRGHDGTGTLASPATGSNIATYTVRKLADGNCWMTDNLQLTLTAGQAVEIAKNSDGTSAGTWTPASATDNGDADHAINRNTKANDSTTGQWYYSWWAATAGSTEDTGGTDAANSICPLGWRLPANYATNNTKSYGAITGAYLNITTNTSTSTGYQTLEAEPLNFGRYGYYSSGSLNNNGSYGVYWSATADGSSNGYYLLYSTSSVSPQYSSRKYGGYLVRCVSV